VIHKQRWASQVENDLSQSQIKSILTLLLDLKNFFFTFNLTRLVNGRSQIANDLTWLVKNFFIWHMTWL